MNVKCYQPGGTSWRYVLHIWWSAHWFLFSKGVGKKEILERQNTRTSDSGGWVQTHIEVLQLGFGGRLVHKLQNSSQVANVDASLSQGLGQCGSIHGQSAVVQTVFNLLINTRFNIRYTTRTVSPFMTLLCVTDQWWDLTGHQEGSCVFEELLLLLDIVCAVVWETYSWINNTCTYTQFLYSPVN